MILGFPTINILAIDMKYDIILGLNIDNIMPRRYHLHFNYYIV